MKTLQDVIAAVARLETIFAKEIDRHEGEREAKQKKEQFDADERQRERFKEVQRRQTELERSREPAKPPRGE